MLAISASTFEWTSRKIDAAQSVDPDEFRGLYAQALAGGFAPPEEEDELVKAIDFIRDPRDGGIYICFGTMSRRRLNEQTLPNMQAHWGAKGADTTVYNWSPEDIEPIPDVTVR